MRRYTLTLALALTATATGCLSDGPTGPHAEVSGSYALQTVNGEPLPVLSGQFEGQNVYILSSALSFDGRQNCTETSIFRYGTGDGAVDDATTETCGYSVNGTRLIISFRRGDMVGRVDASTLTFTVGSTTLVYRK